MVFHLIVDSEKNCVCSIVATKVILQYSIYRMLLEESRFF